jgi:hypothetical protein
MWTTAFLKATGERALRTFAQTLAALIGAGAINIIDVDWPASIGIAATAALLSVLTSIGAHEVGAPGPSFGLEEEL